MALSGGNKIGGTRLRAPLMVSLVLIVFAAIVAGGTGLILTALSNMAFRADLLDVQRAEQTASGALAAIEQQMGSAVSDYTSWDDAAKAVYVDHDRDWIEKNYGIFTGAGTLFDTYFLLTADGATTMSYKDGSPFSVRLSDYFGQSFVALEASLKSEMGREPIRKPALSRLQMASPSWGLLRFGRVRAASRVPESAVYAVFARHLTAPVIRQLARNYVIDGLQLVSSVPPDKSFAAVRNNKGDVLGVRLGFARAGDTQLREVLPAVCWGIAVIGLVLLALLVFALALCAD